MILEIALGIVLGFILLVVLSYVFGFLIEYSWAWVPPVTLAVAGLVFGGKDGMVIFGLVGVLGVLVGKWWKDREADLVISIL